MGLFEECIEVLGKDSLVFSDKDSRQIRNEFESFFPLTKWGRINWDQVPEQADVNIVDDIISFLNQNMNKYSKVVYVIWDEGTLPIIQSTLDKVFEVIDDVTAVSFDTWIMSASAEYVIEIFHDGEVKIGIKHR